MTIVGSNCLQYLASGWSLRSTAVLKTPAVVFLEQFEASLNCADAVQDQSTKEAFQSGKGRTLLFFSLENSVSSNRYLLQLLCIGSTPSRGPRTTRNAQPLPLGAYDASVLNTLLTPLEHGPVITGAGVGMIHQLRIHRDASIQHSTICTIFQRASNTFDRSLESALKYEYFDYSYNKVFTIVGLLIATPGPQDLDLWTS